MAFFVGFDIIVALDFGTDKLDLGSLYRLPVGAFYSAFNCRHLSPCSERERHQRKGGQSHATELHRTSSYGLKYFKFQYNPSQYSHASAMRSPGRYLQAT